MRLSNVFSGRPVAAALFAFALATPSSALHAAQVAPPTRQPAIEVTEADVAASNEKIAMAYGSLVKMWSNQFQQVGERFAAPRVVRYTGGVMTSCGVIMPHNAEYCPRNNTIFYDEVFVAGM